MEIDLKQLANERTVFCSVAEEKSYPHMAKCVHLPNVPLMRKIHAAILEDPLSWDQNYFVLNIGDSRRADTTLRGVLNEGPACKTAYCIAGHAVMLSEDPFQVNKDGAFIDMTVQGHTATDRATHELGLIRHERAYLFAGHRTFDQITAAFKTFARMVGDTF